MVLQLVSMKVCTASFTLPFHKQR